MPIENNLLNNKIKIPQKTIGIIGTRRRNSYKDFQLTEQQFLKIYNPNDIICSGLCPKGGDRFAVMLSKQYKIQSLWFPANWEKYGRSAGFIRNDDIAKHSDILIAVVSNDRTGGTEDTIKKYLKLGKTNLILI